MGVEAKTSFGSISSLWRALALFSCKRGLAFCLVIGLPASRRGGALDRALHVIPLARFDARRALKALGLIVPLTLLTRANEVIE
jgi:hypothetical protein